VGLIDADQHRQRHARTAADIPYGDFVAKMAANVPLGRIGRPEEFAAMACFLCSEAAGFISGTAINVDGGMSPAV
jgi:NAD(P)-dependent dehydrogenase (short-subunit alcohol dehydrogenase family)